MNGIKNTWKKIFINSKKYLAIAMQLSKNLQPDYAILNKFKNVATLRDKKLLQMCRCAVIFLGHKFMKKIFYPSVARGWVGLTRS